jgi:hypothetical protein
MLDHLMLVLVGAVVGCALAILVLAMCAIAAKTPR